MKDYMVAGSYVFDCFTNRVDYSCAFVTKHYRRRPRNCAIENA
jgi:hypothetical protein